MKKNKLYMLCAFVCVCAMLGGAYPQPELQQLSAQETGFFLSSQEPSPAVESDDESAGQSVSLPQPESASSGEEPVSSDAESVLDSSVDEGISSSQSASVSVANMDSSGSGAESESVASSASEESLLEVANAETELSIPEGQTLVLGAEGAFLLRSDGGVAEEIPALEWETPAGLYDAETLINAQGATVYLRSVVAATIAGIQGEVSGTVEIVDGSDITVQASRDTGIEVGSLRIGRLESITQTNLRVSAPQVGIAFGVNVYCGANAHVWADAAQNAILYTGEQANYSDDNMVLRAGAQVIATATGPDGIAIFVNSMQVYGASVTGNAPGGVGGVKISHALLMQQEGQKAVLVGNSDTGRAISCESANISGGDVTGITLNGNIGVHANGYLTLARNNETDGPSSVYGKAHSGYGVVSQNIDDDMEYPSGSLYIESGSVEGYVDEGMGVSSNTVSMYNSYGVTPTLVGTAQKGVGISVCMLNTSGEVYVHGISRGASSEHFQVYGVVPDSAGINLLTYLMISGAATVIGEAPQNVEGSFGIHCLLVYEGGYASGDISAYAGEGGIATIQAIGETGLFANRLTIDAQGSVDAQGAKDGMVLTSLYASDTSGNSNTTITARGAAGYGLKVQNEWESSYSEFHLDSIDLTAVGGEYGLYVSADSEVGIMNSSVQATANGPLAVAGGFIEASQLMDTNARKTTISRSNLEATSPNIGWLFLDTPVHIDAAEYSLPQPGSLKGTGGENGIKIEFSEAHFETFQPGGEPALVATSMVLPDDSLYTIWGVSVSLHPDDVGRSPAVFVPSARIEEGILREEYQAPAKGQLTAEPPYPVYADGMNISAYTAFNWSSPAGLLQAHPQGLTAEGPGSFNAEIIGENQSGEGSGPIQMLDGMHEVRLLSDINIGSVIFNAQGGAPAPQNQLVPLGSLVEPPPDMEKLGHAFLGWYNTATQQQWNFDADSMDALELLLEARWEEIEYTIVFDGNAGDDPTLTGMPQENPLIVTMGSLVPKPAGAPQREGAVFTHWATDREGQTPWDFDNDLTPAADFTLYAIWEYNEHVVTYHALGGLPSEQQERVRFGEAIPGNIETPQRNNFRFEGWYTDWEATIAWEPATPMPDNELDLYAGWTRTHANIIFALNGGEAASKPADSRIVPGETANIAAFQPGGAKAPNRKGYFFLGWLDDAGDVVLDTFIMPQADVHLTAQWKQAPVPAIPEFVVAYRNTRTKVEIEQGLAYTFTYTDLLGRAQSLYARFTWEDSILARGGVEDIVVLFSAPKTEGQVVVSRTVKVYILNSASITADKSRTFVFGQTISQNGTEWNPACYAELPDFANKTIRKVNVPTTFHLGGTNIRAEGTYSPFFTAVYADYFGNVRNLKHVVEAIILPRDNGAGGNAASSGGLSSPASAGAASPAVPGASSPLSAVASSPVLSSSSSALSTGASSAITGGSSGASLAEGTSDVSGEVGSALPGGGPNAPVEYERVNQETLQALVEKGVPIFSLGNTQIPLHSGGLRQVWGLINLVLMLFSLVGAFVLLLYTLAKPKQMQHIRKNPPKNRLLLLTICSGPVMLLLFLILQDTQYLMTLTDRWTPLMLFVTLAQVSLFILMLHSGPKHSDENFLEDLEDTENEENEEPSTPVT